VCAAGCVRGGVCAGRAVCAVAGCVCAASCVRGSGAGLLHHRGEPEGVAGEGSAGWLAHQLCSPSGRARWGRGACSARLQLTPPPASRPLRARPDGESVGGLNPRATPPTSRPLRARPDGESVGGLNPRATPPASNPFGVAGGGLCGAHALAHQLCSPSGRARRGRGCGGGTGAHETRLVRRERHQPC
jgi:hypothetical protein